MEGQSDSLAVLLRLDAKGLESMTLWLFHDRLCFNYQHCPMWQRGGLCFYENAGRYSHEVLSLTAVVGKHDFNVTIWGLRRLSWLVRWIPVRRRPNGSVCGWHVGLSPIGAGDGYDGAQR